MKIRHEAVIAAPPGIVWSLLSAVERWPAWTPTVSRVVPLDAPRLAVGRRFRVRQPGLPVADWLVTEVDANRRFTWQNARLGTRVVARHTIESRRDASVVTLELEFLGVIGVAVGYLTRGLCERYLRIEADGLRRECESTEAALRGIERPDRLPA